MDSWKAEVRRVRREKIRRKKMQVREKVGKSRNTVFFQWFVAPEGRKVGSLKRRVRSQLARWDMKKVHAVVARSTFPSSKWTKNTRGADHFWKLRCRKSARRCGAKHIWKAKCTKHTNVGPLLGVEMSKKCTPLWREAHFKVKMYNATPFSEHFWKLRCRKKCTPLWREAHFEVKSVKKLTVSDHFWRFGCRKSVEKVHAVVARSTFRSQKCKKTEGFEPFLTWRCWKK